MTSLPNWLMPRAGLLFVWMVASFVGPTAWADDVVELFNGRDLSGWAGDAKLWSVADGAITGRTTDADPIPYNTFLVWQGGEVGDFELTFKFRLNGGNSGVQYRSKTLPDAGNWVLGGYQADIDSSGRYTGILYEEKGRGILAERGQKIVIDPQGTRHVVGSLGDAARLFEGIDVTQWNDYVIRAAGNHVQHTINGRLMIDLVDHQAEARALTGQIGLQLHRGPAMTVQFKELKLRRLAADESRILSPEQTPIPDGAQSIPARRPAAANQAAASAQRPAAPNRAAQNRAAQARAEFPLADEARPQWIWDQGGAQPNQTVYFRKEFAAPRGTSIAKLFITCDDSMTVFLDGQRLLDQNGWESPAFVDISKSITGDRPQGGGKRHVLAVVGRNKGGAAGLLAKLVFESGRNPPVALVTDATWQAATKPAKAWQTTEFTARWESARVLGQLGDGPWVKVNDKSLMAVARLREPEATPIERLKVKPGFRVERLYSVPKEEQGSWVNMCVDPKGRLIVSDQYGSLYRLTPPALDGRPEDLQIEKIPADIGGAQGLVWAFDSLYVVVNERDRGGLYRVTDSNGDDQLDHVELLRKIGGGGGEHGPHAVLLSPNGKSLTVVCGNQARLMQPLNGSRVPLIWGEDHLLPRMPDGRGHMAGVLAPGGNIYRVDPTGQNWELISNGFRNEFDAAYNRQGELFAYDADMEWDINTPWYRPTRVCHVTSGAEWGWRNGAGKWPVHYPDSLPPVVDIGPGSPTGVVFGYGARFPAKYQEALYLCDWSYGKLYAAHLEPNGSTYTATVEELIAGTPLPLTDVVIRPQDGAMYFTIGGRRVQSGLYRVTYVGDESTAPVTASPDTPAAAAARQLRHRLESFHGRQDPAAIEVAWPVLGHQDRFLRFAARVAIEHQDPALWAERALAETDPQAALTALLALTRVSAPCPEHRQADTPPVDTALRARLLAALARLSWDDLTRPQQLELCRVYEVLLNRLGPPDEAQRAELIERFAARFPTRGAALNAELGRLLVYLQAPQVGEQLVAMLEAAPTQEEQIEYARSLRMLTTGWTPALRERYFQWFVRAAGYRGGASLSGFLDNIKRDAVATLSDEEKLALAPILEARPATDDPAAALAPRPLVKEYAFDELLPLVTGEITGRNFERGREMFAAARCFACHRFEGRGGSVGPDLTSLAGRFNPRDLLESIVLPSKVVSDQYAAVIIETTDGRAITGRIVNLAGDSMRVMTDMLNPDSTVSVDVKQIEYMENSPVSMMPEGLLNVLTKDEIIDLMAYLLSRGDPDNPMFAQPAGNGAARASAGGQ